MKVLLDTHTFLWLITDDDRLSENARQTFLNTENNLFFSAASLWEICIKKASERYPYSVFDPCKKFDKPSAELADQYHHDNSDHGNYDCFRGS
jgi:hypothetical protein